MQIVGIFLEFLGTTLRPIKGGLGARVLLLLAVAGNLVPMFMGCRADGVRAGFV